MESQEIGLSSICFGSNQDETLPPSIPPNTCCHSHPPPKPVHPAHIPLHRHAAPNPQLSHVMGSFPLRCRNTKCSIKRPIALYQQRRRRQQSPSNGQCITLMGGSNMLRSCVVMLNFCCTNLSFLPQKFCEERWMKGRFGNGD